MKVLTKPFLAFMVPAMKTIQSFLFILFAFTLTPSLADTLNVTDDELIDQIYQLDADYFFGDDGADCDPAIDLEAVEFISPEQAIVRYRAYQTKSSLRGCNPHHYYYCSVLFDLINNKVDPRSMRCK